MNLKVYNVNNGDFAILNEGKTSMIIDCGANKNQVHNILLNDFFVDNSILSRQAMISHFHRDHIKGYEFFINSRNSDEYFDKLYIPKISFDSAGNCVIFYKYLLYCYTIFRSNNSHAIQSTTSILNQISLSCNLVNNISNISPVSYGDKFYINDSKYHVILPNLNIGDFINTEKLNDDIENILNYRPKLSPFKDEINNLAEKSARNLNLFYKSIYTGQDNSEKLVKIEQNIFKNINNIRNKNLQYDDSDDFISFKNRIAKKLKRNINRTSIVFFKYGDNNNYLKLLMTGDAAAEDILRKLNSYNISKISYCKIPHHGTKQYFLHSNNIDIKNLIISGGYNKREPIYIEYPNRYSYSNLYCTNNRSCTFFIGNNLSCSAASSCSITNYYTLNI